MLYILEWTRGAGGAAGATWGECQRPTSIGGGGPKTVRFPYRIRCKSPFFEWFLCNMPKNIASTCSKKARTKKKNIRQTDKQTDDSGLISSSARTVFWTAKSQIPVAKPLKAVPKTSGGFLLRCQLMSTSGSVGRWHSPQVAPAAQ